MCDAFEEFAEIFNYWAWMINPSTPRYRSASMFFWMALNGYVNPITLEVPQWKQ
jgi:hypothetical protein